MTMHDSLFGGGGGGVMASVQGSLVDVLLDPRMGLNRRLEAIHAVLDWAPLAPLARTVRAGRGGRPPYDGLAMLKALVLQRLYALSDPGLEEALGDRASFRRFCGFGLDAATPDETTLCRFRIDAARLGVVEAALAEVNRQLDAQGLILRTGTLVDASIVAARARKPPGEAGLGASAPGEPGAAWTRKGGRSHFGYKVHVGTDEGSGLIRSVRLTPAHVADIAVAPSLVGGDERAVYADKAYESRAWRTALRGQGIKDRIMHRGHKNQAKLPAPHARHNTLIAPRRAGVERTFASLKTRCGLARLRCYTFCRHLADVQTFAIVFNLRRAAGLAAPCP